MKKNTLYIIAVAAVFLTASSCSEKYEIKKPASEITYLAVEALLSDMPGVQTVKLSESIPYTGKNESKSVSGAKVTVSDSEEKTIVSYTEDPENSGLYCSPRNFFGKIGHTYNLRIERDTEDGPQVYEATSKMREFGFDIQKIDYKYTDSLLDSLWTIGVWGTDGAAADYYLVLPIVNGQPYPMDYTIPLEDKYFSGATVTGYPITVLSQTWQNVKVYGQCAKPLETGDIISLLVYDMPSNFYKYMLALVESASAVSIPIISSQPANLPSNLRGENVVGFFSACPTRLVSCFVDDPYRNKFLDEIVAEAN